MEYTYRPSLDDMPTTICLTEYSLTVKQGKKEVTIPYAGIDEVVLKTSGKLFTTKLMPEGGKPIVITNTYYKSPKEVEDRSRAYSTFVRVLHFHLKDKSRANFAVMSSVLKVFSLPKHYSPSEIPLEFLP
jgi:hypothetical protein